MDRIRWLQRAIILPLLFIVLLSVSVGSLAAQALPVSAIDESESREAGPAVVVIPVKQTVEPALHSFLKRAFKEADEAKAEHIVLVVNTFGGRVDSASDIGALIRSSKVPTTAYVEGKAVSAGTYIALNANQIVMQPGSTIGAAAVVNGSGDLIQDPKTVSFWVRQMSEAAKLNGRDPAIAAAMVDTAATASLADKIGRDKKAGEILSLSASEAEKVGYSELTAQSVQEVIAWLGLENRVVIEIEPSIAEKVARFLVHPITATVLLILGIAGIAIELLVPGFGAPGITGLIAFALFFFGSYLSGLAGMEAVILFAVGIVLLVIELFVPSFGILGLLGSASLITGVVIAAPTPASGFVSLVIALAVSTVFVVLFARTHRGRGIWNKFILREKLTTEAGFLSADVKTSMVGQQGIALTPLRPSGTALIGDNRVDVVTAGEFIAVNRPIIVVKAEGTWVVVKEIV